MTHGEAQAKQPPTDEQLHRLSSEPKALISVSDKSGITDFASGVHELGIGIVSTGGTATAIRESGIPVTDVSAITDFPEMLDGRVKTLHPAIHGGILADITNSNHIATILDHDIPYFRLVCVDMYPFESVIARAGVTPAEVNENIDIGGPTMLRAAAKARRIVLSHVSQRAPVLDWLRAGCPDEDAFLEELAARAFYETAQYDMAIAKYLGGSSVSGTITRLQ